MKDKITHLYVDSHERTLILHSLVELKNALIRQGRYTDCIDELIFKVANAPVKKMKIESRVSRLFFSIRVSGFFAFSVRFT